MQETMNENTGRLEIDLIGLLRTYLHKWWVILVCLILGAAIAFGVTYHFVTPMYRTQISIYVNNNKSVENKEYLSSADLSAAQRLVNTYVSIAKSERVLTKISEKLNGEYTVAWLNGALSAKQLSNTEIFCIYVIHEDPHEAARIANIAAEIAPVEIAKIIDGTSAQVVDNASIPTSRYSPSYSQMTLFGGVIGAAVSLVLLTVSFLWDTRIKDENDLTDLFVLPVLGSIPNFEITSSEVRYGYAYGENREEVKNK